jgi:hypothetical protein
MTQSAKLNDIQLILLSTAAQREDGSLLPPPASLGEPRERISKAVPPLIKRALVEEAAVTDPARSWRAAGDEHFGLVITPAGRATIMVGEGTANKDAPPRPKAPDNSSAASQAPARPRQNRKTALLIQLLNRQQGATLLELVDATDWLPHTIRAALTGLRQKGFTIARSERDGHTCWTIVTAAAEKSLADEDAVR